MKSRKGFNVFETIFVFIFIFGVLVIPCGYGWVNNIVKLYDNFDLEKPKNEVIRAIGIPVFPLGIVVGYFELEDENKTEKEV